MPQPHTMKLDPIRKAAILISTLDHRVADELLDRMSEEQAALVRRATLELDTIPEEEQQLVMQEFLGTDGFVASPDEEGIELDEELAKKLADNESIPARPHMSPDREEPPFRFLCDAQVDAIAKHLAHENPQITALVVAHLPPRQAADLLKHFEPQLQASLLRRIAELDTADLDVVREVEKHLKTLLHDDLRAAQNRVIGLSTVTSILTAAGETRAHLISSLTRHDRQLAQQLRHSQHPSASAVKQTGETFSHAPIEEPHRPQPSGHVESRQLLLAAPDKHHETDRVAVTFEDLAQFSAAELALVFAESDSKLALLALAGATPEFVNRLLKHVPTREATSMRRMMERLGPLRLKDIEQAQDAIAENAGRLIAAGRIDRSRSKPFAAAA